MCETVQHNPVFTFPQVDAQLLNVSLLVELHSLCTLVEMNSKGVFWVYFSITYCEVVTHYQNDLNFLYV